MKQVNRRTTDLAINNYGRLPTLGKNLVQIVDFDHSVSGAVPQSGPIQNNQYRAPEVILDAGFSYSADIWSLGAMEFFDDRKLFTCCSTDAGEYCYDEELHLGQITSLLGPPPQWLLKKGRRTGRFYRDDGTFEAPDKISASFNFESNIQNLHGEDKEIFIKFVQRMFTWDPEKRSTAKELLDCPWLYANFPRC